MKKSKKENKIQKESLLKECEEYVKKLLESGQIKIVDGKFRLMAGQRTAMIDEELTKKEELTMFPPNKIVVNGITYVANWTRITPLTEQEKKEEEKEDLYWFQEYEKQKKKEKKSK